MHVVDRYASVFLHSISLREPWAGVRVRVVGPKHDQRLEVEPQIVTLKAGVGLIRLPPQVKVVDPSNGDEIPSERGGFWITTETCDPLHVVCDGLPASGVTGVR